MKEIFGEHIERVVGHQHFARNASAFLLGLLVLSSGGLWWYSHSQTTKLAIQNEVLLQKLTTLENNFASTTAILATTIQIAQNDLSGKLQNQQNSINEQLGNVKNEVGSLSGTLNTLEKLSKTDAELLQKYSKVSFLNEHYKPVQLTQVPAEYTYQENKVHQFHSQAWPRLEIMLRDAKNAGVDLYVFSAFRSFNTQSALKGQYTVTYGAGTANQFSADQGYSEHQLGTTLDFISKGTNGALEGFDKTKAYEWLTANAYRYGFVLSYPKNNAYYIFEPWHWRFVGLKLATYLHDNNKQFYELDQREIDEYLVSLFD